MQRVKELYIILEEMLREAEKDNKHRVLELNSSYETLVPDVYPVLGQSLMFDYDNCRTSCVFAVDKTFGVSDKVLEDAKVRFARIPRP